MPPILKRFNPFLKEQDLSIARGLAVSLIITVSIVSSVTMGFIYYEETQRARLDLEQKADDIIAYQVGVLGKPLWDLDNNAIWIIGKSISQNEVVAELVIKDYFGRKAYSNKKKNRFGSVIRSARVIYDDNYVGDVFISLSKHLYQEGNRNLLFSFMLIILLILSSLIFVSGFLMRTFLIKPLNLLNANIESYANGEYSSLDHYQPYIEFKPFSRVLQQMGEKITEQLKDLSKAEEKYRSIFENAIEGVFQSTPDGKFLNVNPSMAEILGYESAEELLASTNDIGDQFYVVPEDRIKFQKLLDKHNRVLEFETQVYRKDLQTIYVSISARTVRDANGEILHYLGFLVDITRRKKAAETLRQTKEQLALLLESLPIVSFTCKAEGDFGITYVSKTIEEVTGYNPEQFTNNSPFWADNISEEDRENILQELPNVLKQKRYRGKYRFRVADGSYRWFDDTRRLVKTSGGVVSHIAGTWRDITEEKRLRKEAEYRLQQLIQADKMASLGEVVSGVAHEINNPNSFITLNLPQLEETWQVFEPILKDYANYNPNWSHRTMSMNELCDDMVEIIQSIRIGSDRINRIVSDLKDFVRMDYELPLTPVNVNQIIEKAYNIFGAQVRKSVATVKMALCPDLPVVQGHFQKLEQVVTNLVVNSLHAIPEKNNGTISITTHYLPDHSAVVIQVEDNGRGMAPEILDRIFEPFFTLRRESGGTGLGLSVSYGLVKEHNGILGVLSRPGKGSRFSVFLPTDPSVKLELRPAVLCVDRDAAFTQVLQSHFAEGGDLTLLTLDDPEKVLVIAEQKPEIDIIVANLETLCQRGWQILAGINERFPLITVILYSDNPSAIEQKPEKIPNPDFLLIRPFQTEELKEIVATIGRQRL